jgi:tetratricopeptide (TPR) repeat protein
MPQSLSLTMIVKNEAGRLPRALQNARLYADEIVVVDTGSTDETRAIAAKLADQVLDFAWCDDFAAARNHGIERCSKDFVMWLDADDLVSEETARGIRAELAGAVDWDVLVLPYQYGPDMCIPRERLFRNRAGLVFHYPVHECVQWGPPLRSAFRQLVIRHEKHDAALATERNFRILRKAVESARYRDAYRMWWHLGREHVDRNEPAQAALAFLQALRQTNVPVSHQATIRYELGCALVRKGDLEGALAAFGAAIAISPCWREPFFECARLHYHANEPFKAIPLLRACLQIPKVGDPWLQSFRSELYDDALIYDWLACASGGACEYDRAIEYVDRALAAHPGDARLLDNRRQYQEAKQKEGSRP